MKRHGVAVLGTGIMGRRMLTALAPHPRFEVLALWDPREEALTAARELAPAAAPVGGLDALVSHPGVELVYVASPPACHLQGVRAALEAGCAVLCEKPLAHTVGEAQILHDLVVASGLPFAVNFPFARSVAVRRFADIVQGGSLGDIGSAQLTLRFAQWPREWQAGAHEWLSGAAEGGFTREVLSHFVFLCLRLFGPAQTERIAIERLPGQAETRLVARLRHAGVTVEIDAAVAGDVADHNRLEIVGSRDRVALTGWYRLEHEGRTSERVDTTPVTLDGVADLLEGRSDSGLARVDEALAVVQVIEQLLQP
jgi:predicted dehydrogenase